MTTCPHGMPSPASCFECMEAGPVAPASPAPEQTLNAERWITARFDGRCARNFAHDVSAGDPLGYVDGVGWCCEECAE